jgi:ABC-type sulfate transport system permease subunit
MLVSAGMLLATLFVTLPFIVRELIPTLEQMDLAQEEAARSLGANPLQVGSSWLLLRLCGWLLVLWYVTL